jgi:hypothetical protein
LGADLYEINGAKKCRQTRRGPQKYAANLGGVPQAQYNFKSCGIWQIPQYECNLANWVPICMKSMGQKSAARPAGGSKQYAADLGCVPQAQYTFKSCGIGQIPQYACNLAKCVPVCMKSTGKKVPPDGQGAAKICRRIGGGAAGSI